METLSRISEFLDHASRATPVLITIGGLLGYYYREKLKTVLAKSLALDVESLRHTFAKDLAEHTSALQRNLEAYKVSLIAEAEKAKAHQDVRKSIALKMAERRFMAIAGLLDAHSGLDTDVASLVTWPQSADPEMQKYYLQRKREMHDRLGKYTAASDAAQMFLSREVRGKVLLVRRSLLTVLGLRASVGADAIPQTHAEIVALINGALDLEGDLRQIIHEFEQA